MSLCTQCTELRKKGKFRYKSGSRSRMAFDMSYVVVIRNEALVMLFLTRYHTFHLVNN